MTLCVFLLEYFDFFKCFYCYLPCLICFICLKLTKLKWSKKLHGLLKTMYFFRLFNFIHFTNKDWMKLKKKTIVCWDMYCKLKYVVIYLKLLTNFVILRIFGNLIHVRYVFRKKLRTSIFQVISFVLPSSENNKPIWKLLKLNRPKGRLSFSEVKILGWFTIIGYILQNTLLDHTIHNKFASGFYRDSYQVCP